MSDTATPAPAPSPQTVTSEQALGVLLRAVNRLNEQTRAAVEASNAAVSQLQSLTGLVEQVQANAVGGGESAGFPGSLAPDGSGRIQIDGVWWATSATGKITREG